VFHGMTIGKNADAIPRRSDAVEAVVRWRRAWSKS